MEEYVYKNNQKLRCGYTTGSCAAAAAAAAAEFLLSGEREKRVSLMTPSGIPLSLPVEYMAAAEGEARCRVKKDAGDDADVTDGLYVEARVWIMEQPGLRIAGGRGVGRVTKAGLPVPAGEAAINPIPRRMIAQAVEERMERRGFEQGLMVEICVPEGERIAARTMNPALGIEGGISILGTSGMVEPMSEKALVDTIRLEMKMRRATGETCLLVVPGNYGMDFLERKLDICREHAVKCSNFIGETIDMAFAGEVEGLLLVGHIGKLVKLGAGIMDTHSRNGDGRLEVLAACALQAGANGALSRRLLDCTTTEAALDILQENGFLQAVMDRLLERMLYYLKRRGYEGLEIGAYVFSSRHGLLGHTDGAEALLARMKKQWEDRT